LVDLVGGSGEKGIGIDMEVNYKYLSLIIVSCLTFWIFRKKKNKDE